MKTIYRNPKLNFVLATVGLGLLAVVCVWAQSDSAAGKPQSKPDAGNLRAFIELARSDLRTGKAIILAENMPLTEEEGAEFWPLQREYQFELTKLNDVKLTLIQQYAATYEAMTDGQASDLAKKTFDLEQKKTDLKRKYFKKFVKVMPAKKAARFFQIDNQLNMAVDLQLAASLPLIK